MARDHHSRVECQEPIQRRDPAPAVGVSHVRNAPAKHQVARKQHAPLGDVHRQVVCGVGRAHRANLDPQPGQIQILVFGNP